MRSLTPKLLILLISLLPPVPASEQPDRATHLVVITHGYRSPPAFSVPAWATRLRKKLETRGSDCLVVDWVAESNDAAEGWAEAAAAQTMTRIEDYLKLHEAVDVHLIGYSRGTVVNSEIQRRIYRAQQRGNDLTRRIRSVGVTMVDAHPANGQVNSTHRTKYAAAVTHQFERLTRDPNPQFWPNTTCSSVYFQETKTFDDGDALVNPWGASANSSIATGAEHVVELTDQFFTRSGCHGNDVTQRINHLSIIEWYVAHGVEDDPACRCRRSAFMPTVSVASHRALNDETIFNGDFRFAGGPQDGLLALTTERMRVPGWSLEGRASVTKDGCAELNVDERTKNQHSILRHQMLRLPHDAGVIRFDIENGNSAPASGQLTVAFVEQRGAGIPHRCVLGVVPSPETDTGNAVQLAIPDCLQDRTGQLTFELRVAESESASIRLDNIRFESRRSASNSMLASLK